MTIANQLALHPGEKIVQHCIVSDLRPGFPGRRFANEFEVLRSPIRFAPKGLAERILP